MSAGRYGGSWEGPVSPDEAEENFRRWFSGSSVVDADGEPIVLYHATPGGFDSFEAQRGKDAGFHFGTLAQAEMRGYRQDQLLAVYLRARHLKRLKDTGSWSRDRIAAVRRQGYDGIVYLNRYEGMTSERVQALDAAGLLHRLDSLSDAQFRRAVPEAEDSYVVFEPTQIKAVDNPGTWCPSDTRFADDGADEPASAPAP